jgi:predicted nucleotidyltransferase
MERSVALEKVKTAANLITKGARKIENTQPKNLPLMATLPLLSVSEGFEDPGIIDPDIREILLFGSLARGNDWVGDIDMMILDEGFYSNFFTAPNEVTEPWYEDLGYNLGELLTQWFDFDPEDPKVNELMRSTPVDLHVLPADILYSGAKRDELLEHHHDPDFFENAFSDLMRFDGDGFVSIDRSHLVTKHKMGSKLDQTISP